MKFHSGFALQNEQGYFDSFLQDNDYTVAGFSYGAIKALKEVLATSGRIDRLILLSPAFFQTKNGAYINLQLKGFTRDRNAYIEKFLANCFSPCEIKDVEIDHDASLEQLEELLTFEWSPSIMAKLKERKIEIEVYLGSEDRIIDVSAVREFFIPYATVTIVRGANHFLEQCKGVD